MEATGLAYARFMDDWATLASTRWKFRAAIRLVNETLAELHVHQYPDRTFVGRPAGGLASWVIYLLPRELRVASRAVERCVVCMSRLYEEGMDLVRIGTCARPWQRWAKSGLQELGEELSERAYDLASGSLGGHGLPHWHVLPWFPTFAEPTVGDAREHPYARHPHG
jgi:hypothetical protein